jgi:hypothetical protein
MFKSQARRAIEDALKAATDPVDVAALSSELNTYMTNEQRRRDRNRRKREKLAAIEAKKNPPPVELHDGDELFESPPAPPPVDPASAAFRLADDDPEDLAPTVQPMARPEAPQPDCSTRVLSAMTPHSEVLPGESSLGPDADLGWNPWLADNAIARPMQYSNETGWQWESRDGTEHTERETEEQRADERWARYWGK